MRWALLVLAVGCSFDRAGLTGDPGSDAPVSTATDAPTTSQPDAAPTQPPPDARAPDATACPEKFTQLPTGCYYHGGTEAGLTGDLEFLEAEAACEDLGGHLAVIDDAIENAALTEWAGADTPYIGMTDLSGEGNWLWVTDATLGYTNWNGGEPNDGGWGDEECGELRADGKWNDVVCWGWKHYLCEWDGLPVGSEWMP